MILAIADPPLLILLPLLVIIGCESRDHAPHEAAATAAVDGADGTQLRWAVVVVVGD